MGFYTWILKLIRIIWQEWIQIRRRSQAPSNEHITRGGEERRDRRNITQINSGDQGIKCHVLGF